MKSVHLGSEYRAVFISTVRSRQLASKLHDDSTGSEFGFLSEQKLLNTALTRAKSWIGVVGDPVALCSIGECSGIWKTYIKQCCGQGGIVPRELKFEDIWMQAQQLPFRQSLKSEQQISTKSMSAQVPSLLQASTKSDVRTGSVPNAQLAQKAATPVPELLKSLMDLPTGFNLPTSSAQKVERSSASNVTQNVLEAFKKPTESSVARPEVVISSKDVANQFPRLVTGDKMVQKILLNPDNAVVSFEEWSLDYQVEPDEIIRQLARVSIRY